MTCAPVYCSTVRSSWVLQGSALSAISEIPCASVSKRVFVQNLSYENELDLHKKRTCRDEDLFWPRHKPTWKWRIEQTTKTWCGYRRSFLPARRLFVLIIFCFPFFPHSASSLCFAEKTIYTQEVLAVVLHQLMEMNPLPTLFMRTVTFFIPLF